MDRVQKTRNTIGHIVDGVLCDRKGSLAKRRHQAANDEEISFEIGDIIEDVEKVGENWWIGSVDGKRGGFPADHAGKL